MAFVEKQNRSVIPRWRTFRSTLLLQELASAAVVGAADATESGIDFLEGKIDDWKKHRSVWHATDLVGAAVALGREAEVRDATEFIASEGSAATSHARDFVRALLEPNGQVDLPLLSDSDVHTAIHTFRVAALAHPQNAIVWVDLALAYTILGLRKRAERAITIALKLSPTNRFVLRSASRFYVHEGSPDFAHHLLIKGESTESDPWLIAAELAVASAGKLHPQLAKKASSMVMDESIHPFELTELASALATLELESGNHLKARRLFHKALVSPNENTVAQAEWASTQLRSLSVNTQEFEVPRLFEANAWTSFQKGDWQDALRSSDDWLEDQPFSSRPAILSSFLESVIFEDNETAETVLKRSLMSNPTDPVILNNLAFAQASLGKVKEAEDTLVRIDESVLTGLSRVTVPATRGLVKFRGGRPDEGRALYQMALNEAGALGLKSSKAMAAIFLAREEVMARSPNMKSAVQRALAESDAAPSDAISVLRERLKRQFAAAADPSTGNAASGSPVDNNEGP